MIDTTLFPHQNFPVRLEIKLENRVCWFKDEYDLQKYLTRYRLDDKTVKIDYRDEKPIKSSKKHKGSVEPKSKPKSNGSAGSVRKRKSSMDSVKHTTRNSKSKK
jgi:hypothetical protein